MEKVDLETYLYRLQEPGATIYSVLGLPEGTDPLDVKKASKKASLVLHPDKGGTTAGFQKLGNLLDKELKPKKKKTKEEPKPEPKPKKKTKVAIERDIFDLIDELAGKRASKIKANDTMVIYFYKNVDIPKELQNTSQKAKGVAIATTEKYVLVFLNKNALENPEDTLSDYLESADFIEFVPSKHTFASLFKKFQDAKETYWDVDD